MADIEFDDVVGGMNPFGGAGISSVVNFMGAATSVVLIAGLTYWGYELMVRDVTGVPVVRAIEGPMRIAPDNPGGLAAEYQGLAVNNIAAEGEAAEPAERMVLAPRPNGLAEEDQPVPELAMVAPPSRPAAPEVHQDAVPMIAATEDSAPLAEEEEATEDTASLIEQALLMATEEEEAGAALLAEPVGTISPDLIPRSVPGVRVSMRPTPRPEERTTLQATPVVDQGAGFMIIDPATIPVGTRLAQLGAFDSQEIAESEWQRLSAEFSDFMAGKARVIQEAQSGGKTFFRLRAHGFDDLNDARRFCSALLAGKANCIPVVTR